MPRKKEQYDVTVKMDVSAVITDVDDSAGVYIDTVLGEFAVYDDGPPGAGWQVMLTNGKLRQQLINLAKTPSIRKEAVKFAESKQRARNRGEKVEANNRKGGW